MRDHAITLGAVLFLHGVVLAVLLSFETGRSALREAKTLIVSIVQPEPPQLQTPPPPRITPRPPAPARIHPPPAAPAPPLVARPVEATSQDPAPLAPAPPPPFLLASPPTGLLPGPSAEASSATKPLPIVPPSFNAAYLNNPAPAYPVAARRLGEQGRVVLRVQVDATGAPVRVEVRDSSGSRRLDDTAREAVGRWRFTPARQGDLPVVAWVLVPILFSLESQ